MDSKSLYIRACGQKSFAGNEGALLVFPKVNKQYGGNTRQDTFKNPVKWRALPVAVGVRGSFGQSSAMEGKRKP